MLRSEGAVISTMAGSIKWCGCHAKCARDRLEDQVINQFTSKKKGQCDEPDGDYIVPMFTKKIAKLAHGSV